MWFPPYCSESFFLETRKPPSIAMPTSPAAPTSHSDSSSDGAAAEKDGDVVVAVEDPSQLRWMFAKLSSIEVNFREMYTRRETLEDVFLDLIGSKMEEGVLQG